jgi:hypothetical protein
MPGKFGCGMLLCITVRKNARGLRRVWWGRPPACGGLSARQT